MVEVGQMDVNVQTCCIDTSHNHAQIPEAVHTGNIELRPKTMKCLLKSFMPGIVCIGQKCRPNFRLCQHKNITMEKKQTIHNRQTWRSTTDLNVCALLGQIGVWVQFLVKTIKYIKVRSWNCMNSRTILQPTRKCIHCCILPARSVFHCEWIAKKFSHPMMLWYIRQPLVK